MDRVVCLEDENMQKILLDSNQIFSYKRKDDELLFISLESFSEGYEYKKKRDALITMQNNKEILVFKDIISVMYVEMFGDLKIENLIVKDQLIDNEKEMSILRQHAIYYKELPQKMQKYSKDYKFSFKELKKIQTIEDYNLTKLINKQGEEITVSLYPLWKMYYELIVQKIPDKKRRKKLSRGTSKRKYFYIFLNKRKQYKIMSRHIFTMYLLLLINLSHGNETPSIFKKESVFQDICNISPYREYMDELLTNDIKFKEVYDLLNKHWLHRIL